MARRLRSKSLSTSGLESRGATRTRTSPLAGEALLWRSWTRCPPLPDPEFVADAGPDQTVEATSLSGGADVTFDGTGSINPNPDDGELAYLWTVCDQPREDPLSPCRMAGQEYMFFGPTPTWELPIGTTEVELTVGVTGPEDTDTVLITVTPRQSNALPVVNAGPDQTFLCTVQEGDAEACSVPLDGSETTDPDGDPLTYEWHLTLGDVISTEVAPVVSLPAGTHTITLFAYDGFDGSDSPSDTVIVTVSVDVNRPPVAVPHVLELLVECVGPNGTAVTLDARGLFTDPDNDPLTFSWAVPSLGLTATGDNVVVSLPLGTHQVTLTVDDMRGGVLIDGGLAIVRDTTPPTLTLSLSPSVIQTPDHTMVPITPTIQVLDQCDAAPTVALTSITSNEPDNGTGAGDTIDESRRRPGRAGVGRALPSSVC